LTGFEVLCARMIAGIASGAVVSALTTARRDILFMTSPREG
jgi:hypothetical protein